MRILFVDPERPAPEALEEAAAVLRGGGLVAFPTETVYGLGANALDPAAVRRIFEAKGRPHFNPLIAHVADQDGARRLAARWPVSAERLARAFWPGPLTLVLPKHESVPDLVTAGLGTVALRVPAHPVARALLRAARTPLAAPSANRYTQLSPTTAAHVAKALGDRVELILDGGPTQVGIESTVVDVSGEEPILLRPGVLSVPELEAVAGRIRLGSAPDGDTPRPSPGMVARHYSPRAELRVFAPDQRPELERVVREAAAAGRRVGGVLLGRPPELLDAVVEMPPRPDAYARELYAALHRLDDEGCELIVVDAPPSEPAWAGVRDRLARAERPD